MFNLKKINLLLTLKFIFIWYLIITTVNLINFEQRGLFYNINFYKNIYFNNYTNITIITITLLTTNICFILKKYMIIKNKLNIYLIFLFLTLAAILFVSTQNTISMFIFYEFLLIPSAILVYFFSPNVRSKKVATYFLFWTQLGSFFVLVGTTLLYKQYGVKYLHQLHSINVEDTLIYTSHLILIGFLIKIPIWPFHFWLTKTHVEANTSFSIFLSGVLVKTALLGLYKYQNLLFSINTGTILVIIIFSLIDIAIKVTHQVDLKKLIAYLTVQEMSLLVFLIFFKNISNLYLYIYTLIFHTICSITLFFINDCIYKRYGNRQLHDKKGLLNGTPMLSLYIFVITMLFLGIPISIKFIIEIQFMFKFLELSNYLYTLFIVLVQYITIVVFYKSIINTLFGKSILLKTDLTKVENILLLFVVTIFIYITFN